MFEALLQGVPVRHEANAIVATTDEPGLSETGAFPTSTSSPLATALIDRLMHHGEAIVIRGDSYRMKDKQPDEQD